MALVKAARLVNVIKRPERIASGVAKRFGLLGLIATVLVALLGFLAPAASASALPHAQTRVAAIGNADSRLVAPHDSVLAVQGRERAPDYDRSATGSSVAAEGGMSLDQLAASGTELDPAEAGGQLTRAGRAFAKAGEVFGPTSGGPAAINEAGLNALALG